MRFTLSQNNQIYNHINNKHNEAKPKEKEKQKPKQKIDIKRKFDLEWNGNAFFFILLWLLLYTYTTVALTSLLIQHDDGAHSNFSTLNITKYLFIFGLCMCVWVLFFSREAKSSTNQQTFYNAFAVGGNQRKRRKFMA